MSAKFLGLTYQNFVDFFCIENQNFFFVSQYDPLVAYSKNEKVKYESSTWISLIDNNTTPPLPMQSPLLWNQINSYKYITKLDIETAMQMAYGWNGFDWNSGITPTYIDETFVPANTTPPIEVDGMIYTNAQLGLLNLTAHYVVHNRWAVTGEGSAIKVTTSESIDRVSKSLAIPTSLVEKLGYYLIADTEYGMFFLRAMYSTNKAKSVGFWI